MLSIPPLAALHWWPYESLLEDWPPRLTVSLCRCVDCNKNINCLILCYDIEKNKIKRNLMEMDWTFVGWGLLKMSYEKFQVCVMFPCLTEACLLEEGSAPLDWSNLAANPWQGLLMNVCLWLNKISENGSTKTQCTNKKSSSNFQLLFFLQVLGVWWEFWRWKEAACQYGAILQLWICFSDSAPAKASI